MAKNPHAPLSNKQVRRKVRTAIECGRLQRKPCEICGATKSEAHHRSYDKPLDVQWLCAKHHMANHTDKIPVPRGESNGQGGVDGCNSDRTAATLRRRKIV